MRWKWSTKEEIDMDQPVRYACNSHCTLLAFLDGLPYSHHQPSHLLRRYYLTLLTCTSEVEFILREAGQ